MGQAHGNSAADLWRPHGTADAYFTEMTSPVPSTKMPQNSIQDNRPYRIASLPGRGRPNPYVDLFYDAMAQHGVELACEMPIDIKCLKAQAQRLDAIHIHWPHHFLWVVERAYKPNWQRYVLGAARRVHPRAPRQVRKLLEIHKQFYLLRYPRKILRTAKRAGLRVLWTVHNIESHFDSSRADCAIYKALAAYADVVILHSMSARAEFLRHYRPRGELVVMPHGNYEGRYPAPRPRDDVLRELGLSADLPVVSCVGGLRSNKGLDTAVAAAAKLRGDTQLVVAGTPQGGFDTDSLRASISAISGAVLIARRISDQEFADIVNISEAVLLPYRQITGSGALLAALTLGRGVIASDLPYFREVLATEPYAGILVQPGNAAALADAIQRYLSIPSSVREEAAAHLASRYEWSKVVCPVVDILRAWVEQA